jgi:hypothetical protein
MMTRGSNNNKSSRGHARGVSSTGAEDHKPGNGKHASVRTWRGKTKEERAAAREKPRAHPRLQHSIGPIENDDRPWDDSGVSTDGHIHKGLWVGRVQVTGVVPQCEQGECLREGAGEAIQDIPGCVRCRWTGWPGQAGEGDVFGVKAHTGTKV